MVKFLIHTHSQKMNNKFNNIKIYLIIYKKKNKNKLIKFKINKKLMKNKKLYRIIFKIMITSKKTIN